MTKKALTRPVWLEGILCELLEASDRFLFADCSKFTILKLQMEPHLNAYPLPFGGLHLPGVLGPPKLLGKQKHKTRTPTYMHPSDVQGLFHIW